MSDDNPTLVRTRTADDGLEPLAVGEPPLLRPEDYRDGFGEDLTETLRIDNWRTGTDLAEEYRRIDQEVQQAVERETDLQRRVREEVLSRLAWGPAAPPGAGVHPVPLEEITEVHRGLLFPGGVEAVDGTNQIHDSLALTIYQIGVGLVSYGGNQGTWCQRLFRHDLRLRCADPVEEMRQLLERRGRRNRVTQQEPRDLLSELAQRTLMSFGERAVLLQKSQAVWRMGHGNPAPLELFTAGGYADLMIASVKLLRDLIVGHQKFVFVASEPADRLLLTIGQALRPLEFAVVGTLREQLEEILLQIRYSAEVSVDATWDGRLLTPAQWLRRFLDEVASQVVVGVYRATLLAPPQVFYAHVDHADIAARVALADSVLQEERGFPLLIDLADQVCKAAYGGGSLKELAQAAYAAAGTPYQFTSERATRTQ